MQEVSLSTGVEAGFAMVTSIGSLFLMGLFFLVSGLLTPPALERKGIRRFVVDRLLRLGIPFAAFTLLLWPLTVYAIREPFLHRGSYWWGFVNADSFPDNGPLWFVGVLLIYSLGYAAWRAGRRRPPTEPRDESVPLRARTLVGLGAAIAVITFLVRLRFPANSAQAVNLHLWEWPQCLGMFGLGVAAARRGWLMPVSDRLRRGCGLVALLATLSLPALIFTSDPLGLEEEAYFGGFGWPAAATAVVEGALTVAACVWILGFAQRHLNRPGRPAWARSAYAAFLVQGPVLIGLALALRPVPVPAEVKAVVLAVTGVAGSFAIARPLVFHTPLGRIL